MPVPRKSVSSTLLELTAKAKRDRKYRFRSLYREIDLRMLYDSFWLLKRKAAVGVDGVSWQEYEKDLDANLRDLLDRLVTQRYRAKLIRRKSIPKGNGKLRPLGIPSLEDKIVQMSARRLLEARWSAYAEALVRVDTNGHSVEDVTSRILEILENAGTRIEAE